MGRRGWNSLYGRRFKAREGDNVRGRGRRLAISMARSAVGNGRRMEEKRQQVQLLHGLACSEAKQSKHLFLMMVVAASTPTPIALFLFHNLLPFTRSFNCLCLLWLRAATCCKQLACLCVACVLRAANRDQTQVKHVSCSTEIHQLLANKWKEKRSATEKTNAEESDELDRVSTDLSGKVAGRRVKRQRDLSSSRRSFLLTCLFVVVDAHTGQHSMCAQELTHKTTDLLQKRKKSVGYSLCGTT